MQFTFQETAPPSQTRYVDNVASSRWLESVLKEFDSF